MKSQQVMVKIYPIRLGQFLKFANVTSDGIEAKILITENKVLVNGVFETRRGRQLKKGDLVFANDISYLCS
jgi:ribosome-associated protein